MSDAREEILGRVRAALRDVPADEGVDDVAVRREYRRHDQRPPEELIELFAQRVRDYHAEVRVVPASELSEAIASACGEMGLRRVAVPADVPAQWRPTGLDVVQDDGLSAQELDQVDGSITGCAAAIAETGTVVLDGRDLCGRRVITLVPDNHICVVAADQVVGLVPEALARVKAGVCEQGLPVTLISGPSASSDIELSRVEGVHGPRHLRVLIAVADR